MDQIPGILKALADETRWAIIHLLLTHEFCVGGLAKRLNLSEAAVSQHLQVLRKAGVITGEKRGYYTHYQVNREVLKKISEALLTLTTLVPTPPHREGNCHRKSLGECQYCPNKDQSHK